MGSRILVLWATPRSASTAFEWMMRQRGDIICLHEPFGSAYYRGADRRTTRPDENPLEPERTYESTWRDILAVAERGRVFMKEMATHVSHLIDDEFLSNFEHTFLVRDPAQSLPSMYSQWNRFTSDEAGYHHLHAMFERVTELRGSMPPVIDANDLLDEPDATVRAYCEAVGIDFMPEALRWEPGNRSEVRWYGGDWHERLASSSGLRRQDAEHVGITDVPFLVEIYEECLPYYERLTSHRLRPAK